MDDLAYSDNVFVVQRGQVLDLSQSCEREALIRHLVHDHVELLESVVLHFSRQWVLILSLVNFPERSFADFLNFIEV